MHTIILYHITGNIQGVQFSWIGNRLTSRGSIFTNMHDCVIYMPVQACLFHGLIFIV